jgi:hypothetical protein
LKKERGPFGSTWLHGDGFTHAEALAQRVPMTMAPDATASVCGWLYWRFRQNRWLSPIPVDGRFLPPR